MCFADGATLQVGASARFEIPRKGGFQLKSGLPNELQIGEKLFF
jgi:hypothetical protein